MFQTLEERKSPMKTDLFTDLDPLGTGKVKPYLDKKDFFQELKNPPKKVLKELISEPSKPDASYYFPADFENQKKEPPSTSTSTCEPSVIKNTSTNTSSDITEALPKEASKYSRIDPFEDMDPFEKTDPFLEDSFPKSIGFPSLVSAKASADILHERAASRHEKQASRTRTPEDRSSESPSKSNIFSSSIHGPLRVSLPPEKADTNTTISLSSLASRFRSSPSPTEEPKTLKRKHYQALKHSYDDKSDDQSNSPILEEVYMRGSPKPFNVNTYDKKISIGSPPPVRSEKVRPKVLTSLELLDPTPDPPPRPKTTLFAIKPPPLPPKKQNQPTFRPPARPPSLEENIHYDYLRQKAETSSKVDLPPENESSPKKKPSFASSEALKRQNSFENFSDFPKLPRPPQRKTSVDSSSKSQTVTTPTSVRATSPEKEPSVLNITLNQLDQSGFESLANTLGIPTENVCNLTLQELTKILAQKYLGSGEEKSDNFPTEIDVAFHADFDSNFSELASAASNSTGYDKYAVFKELIDEERSVPEPVNDCVPDDGAASEAPHLEENIKTIEEDEEDKYAALRHLSLTAQKSENLSEELDVSNEEDSSARADNISDIIKQTDESFTPLHSSEIVNESPVARLEPLDDIEEVATEEKATAEDGEWAEPREAAALDQSETDKYSAVQEKENALFGSTDNDNWANFEKEPMHSDVKPSENKSNDNENSPLSSDGKDDLKSKSTWLKNKSRDDFPWKDEDESCDDYSAKESYWSDESSHDGQSPVKENLHSYQRKAWNKHARPSKGPPGWGEEGHHWQRRWQDDTEDEYDDFRRRRRLPPTSFDRERKKDLEYEGRDRPFVWGWDDREADRFERGYGDRRKPLGEYRRRCDSDASDKEYVAIDRSYPDPPVGKAKQYYGHSREPMERHWSDSRESRSKYKRPTSHKRPSSASDAKRYEKIYSPIEHLPRSPDKRDSEDEDYTPRFRPSRKDLRYHSNIEHYGSYDRRVQATYQRRMQRGKRMKDGDMTGSLMSETRHFFPPETPKSTQSEDTPEPTKEIHFKFEDDFIPSPAEPSDVSCKKSASVSPSDRVRLREGDWGRRLPKKEVPPANDNNNEQFANFNDGFEVSPMLPKDKGKVEGGGGVIKKPSLKGRGHLGMLGRQDSTTSLRKSESINIFSRENDPFEDDDFFSSGNSGGDSKLGRFFAEKSKSNSNVSDPFAWKEMFGDCKFED